MCIRDSSEEAPRRAVKIVLALALAVSQKTAPPALAVAVAPQGPLALAEAPQEPLRHGAPLVVAEPAAAPPPLALALAAQTQGALRQPPEPLAAASGAPLRPGAAAAASS